MLSKDAPYRSFEEDKKYLHCDDEEFGKAAVEITIFSWLTAKTLLQNYGVEVYFVLQPTATYYPERYNLDYIIDLKKQAIANEKSSYTAFYELLKTEWVVKCQSLDACDSFIDLSELYFGRDEPIFIDTSHVSPNGNRLVAEALRDRF